MVAARMMSPDAHLLDSAFLVRIRKDLTSRWPTLWDVTERGDTFPSRCAAAGCQISVCISGVSFCAIPDKTLTCCDTRRLLLPCQRNTRITTFRHMDTCLVGLCVLARDTARACGGFIPPSPYLRSLTSLVPGDTAWS